MFKRGIIIFLIVFSSLIGHAFASHFVDDWINQKITTGPNHFNTQKRGFGTFGSASMRWQVSNDHPVTVTPPSYKAGCGGIDLFMGGYSFLKFDQLVKKFEKVMGPGAAAFAFDIAMSVLSQQASESIKSLSAMVDRLNQLQFDDCKASKAMAVTVLDGFSPETFSKKKTEAVQDFVTSTGVQDLYHTMGSFGKNKSVQAAAQNAGAGAQNQMVAGCPNEIKDIFFREGFILDHLGAKRGLTDNHTALMRGVIGDFYVNGTTLDVAPVEACAQNNGKTIDAMIRGEVFYKPANDPTCRQITSLSIGGQNYTSIRNWCYELIRSVATKIGNKSQALTNEEEVFLSSIPAPIYTAIETRMGELSSNPTGPQEIANTFADFVALIHVYNMLSDFYAAMDNVVRLAVTTYEASQGSASGANQENCKIEIAQAPLKGLVEKKKDLSEKLRIYHSEYSNKLQELNNNMQINENLTAQKEYYNKRLGSIIGQGAAKRMTR